MQLLVKQDDNSIVQSQILKSTGQTTTANGMYTIVSPLRGLPLSVDDTSYILNGGAVDSGSILTSMYNDLLAQFPAYNNIVFNSFVQVSDLAEIELSGSIPSPVNPLVQESVRYQVGRVFSAPTGVYANAVAVLGENATVSPTRPGLIITNNIDLSVFTPSVFSNFMVYWRIVDITTSHDVNSSVANSAALREIVEVDQEPATFSVLFSRDGGTTYQAVDRLKAFTVSSSTSSVRLAFRNTASSKVYLAAYAILF